MFIWIPIKLHDPETERKLKNGEMSHNQVREIIVTYRKKLNLGKRKAKILFTVGVVCPIVVFLFEKALGDINMLFFIGTVVGLFGAFFQVTDNFYCGALLKAAAQGYPDISAQTTEEIVSFQEQWNQYLR